IIPEKPRATSLLAGSPSPPIRPFYLLRRCARCGAGCPGCGSLHWRLYINALATFLTDERFDDGEATKHVGRSAVRTPGATNVVGVKFNQSYASAVGGNRSTTAPQELQTRSATPPFATTMRQPSQSDP